MRARASVTDAIVERLFPELRYGEDPDIERYFDLRASGRLREALAVYDKRLRSRYPEDTSRILLLKLYRQRDPRYPAYLAELVARLAESIASKLKSGIALLSAPIDGLDLRNAFACLKAVEAILTRLPQDEDEAMAALESYADFAQLTGFRQTEMARARDMTKEYLQQSAASEEADYDMVARAREMEEDNRRKEKSRYFDFSRVSFSDADRRRIEIPGALERKEDKVLAYCYKYWLLCSDPGFERLVFLFSRKFGTQHYDIFRAIKIAKRRKSTDDEILNTVSTIISSRYSYSVQGDLYMQGSWRRLKARLLAQEKAEADAAKEEDAEVAARDERKPRRQASPLETIVETKEPDASGTVPSESEAAKAQAPERQSTPETAPAQINEEDGKTLALSPIKRNVSARLQPRPKAQEALPLRVSSSVSDRVKRLSGKSYDLYRELFLKEVRSSIHAHLLHNQSRQHSLFDDAANEAEDIIYGFIQVHYDDPYMDWEGSKERESAEGLGFALPSLDPIIDRCYARL